MQVLLGRHQRAMPGDLPQDLCRHASVSHPCQSGMTQVMTPQVAMSELGYHVVPVRGVTQDRGGDPAAARSGEQACHRIIADDIQPSLHERAYLPDDWHPSCPLALG